MSRKALYVKFVLLMLVLGALALAPRQRALGPELGLAARGGRGRSAPARCTLAA